MNYQQRLYELFHTSTGIVGSVIFVALTLMGPSLSIELLNPFWF